MYQNILLIGIVLLTQAIGFTHQGGQTINDINVKIPLLITGIEIQMTSSIVDLENSFLSESYENCDESFLNRVDESIYSKYINNKNVIQFQIFDESHCKVEEVKSFKKKENLNFEKEFNTQNNPKCSEFFDQENEFSYLGSIDFLDKKKVLKTSCFLLIKVKSILNNKNRIDRFFTPY